MLPIMEKISQFLMCNLKTYKIKNSEQILSDVLSVNVTGINKLSLLIDYFNKYPLLGVKNKDFKDWERAYHMIISKQHITETGRLKIISIKSNMNSRRT